MAKSKQLMLMVGALGMAGSAVAQSSVQIYGLIDIGLTAYKTQSTQPRLDSGISFGSRLGFRGTEDLGDGLSAVFNLEMPIQADSGNIPGAVFGRESWAGFKSSRWGTLTMGRQTDFMVDFQVLYTSASFVGGAYTFHPGDYDRVSGVRYDNSLKWVSPAYGPVRLGAMLALGEVAGSDRTNQGKSLGATYQSGPWSASLTYTSTNDQVIDPRAQLGINTLNGAALTGALTTNRVDIVGAGAGYRAGPLWVKVLHTRATLKLPNGSPTLATTDLNGSYSVTPNSRVGAGAWHANLDGNNWTKYFVGYDYQFSKRTNVYVSYTHLKTNAGNRAVMLALPPSSTNTASALRVAVMHRF